MRIVSLMLIICVVALMFVGQSLYNSDIENDTIRDIYNETESNFNWSNYSTSINKILTNEMDDEYGIPEYDINVKRFKNILIKFVDFVGYSSFEGVKWGVEYGYTHPEHDLKFFLEFLIKIFWIILIIALIPLVIPLLAIIYLFCKGSWWVIKKVAGKKDG